LLRSLLTISAATILALASAGCGDEERCPGCVDGGEPRVQLTEVPAYYSGSRDIDRPSLEWVNTGNAPLGFTQGHVEVYEWPDDGKQEFYTSFERASDLDSSLSRVSYSPYYELLPGETGSRWVDYFPENDTPDYAVMCVLDQIPVDGPDGRVFEFHGRPADVR
jgi:hypothetical protein